MTAPIRRNRRKYKDVPEEIAARSHFTVSRVGPFWEIVVRRRGRRPVSHLCGSQGEANRLRQVLSASGLVGYVLTE